MSIEDNSEDAMHISPKQSNSRKIFVDHFLENCYQLRIYNIGYYTLSMVYDILNEVNEGLHLSLHYKVRKLRKFYQQTVFKVVFKEPIPELFYNSLVSKGSSMFKIQMIGDVIYQPQQGQAKLYLSSLRIATQNVHSLLDKYEVTTEFLNHYNLDIFAIQETNRTKYDINDWKPDGYYIIEHTIDQKQKGILGLAIVVRKSLNPSLLEIPSANSIWIEIPNKSGSIFVCNVYIPTQNVTEGIRVGIIKDIFSKLKKLITKHPNNTIIVMGDFNMKREELNRVLTDHGISICILSIPDNETTYNNVSVIDYILCYTKEQLSWDKGVLVNEINSDHNAILTTIYKTERATIPFQYVNREKSLIEMNKCDENQLYSLSSISSSSDIITFCKDLKNVLFDKGFVEVKMKKKFKKEYVKKSDYLIEAIKKKHELLKSGKKKEDYDQNDINVLETVKNELQRLKEYQLSNHLRKGIEEWRKGNKKALWKWVNEEINGSKYIPYYITEEEENHLYEEHISFYKSLFHDESNHSKDNSYWTSINCHYNMTINSEQQVWLNRNIEYEEMKHVIKRMKSSGCYKEDFPIEVFQGICNSCTTDNSILKKLLLDSVNALYNGFIPTEYSTFILILKPENQEKVGWNYHDIYYIPTLIRIVNQILANRIRTVFEDSGIIVDYQGAYRDGYSKIGMISSFCEIIDRITLPPKSNLNHDNHRAYVCFMKFMNAFEHVPHEGLLYKLKQYGLCGNSLNYISKLLSNMKLRVVNEYEHESNISIKRGLIPSCPLSTILFLLYTNDILQSSNTNQTDLYTSIIPTKYLLFADELCIITETKNDLKKMINEVDIWSTLWELPINMNQVAIMVFGDDLGSNSDINIKMGHKRIQMVTSYDYLGLPISIIKDKNKNYIDYQRMHDTRIELGRQLYSHLKRVLVSQIYPLHLRIDILKNILLPVMLHGCEIWGKSNKICQTSTNKLNAILREMVDVPTKSSIMSLQLEFDLPSFYYFVLERRMRLIYTELRTNKLLISLLNSINMISSKNNSFLKNLAVVGSKMLLKYDMERLSQIQNQERVNYLKTISKAGKSAREYFFLFLEESDSLQLVEQQWVDLLRSLGDYFKNGVWLNRLYMDVWEDNPILGHYLNDIVKMRCDLFYSCEKINPKIKVGEKVYCPCCNKEGLETINHYLIECERFTNQRKLMEENVRKKVELYRLDISYLSLCNAKSIINNTIYLENKENLDSIVYKRQKLGNLVTKEIIDINQEVSNDKIKFCIICFEELAIYIQKTKSIRQGEMNIWCKNHHIHE